MRRERIAEPDPQVDIVGIFLEPLFERLRGQLGLARPREAVGHTEPLRRGAEAFGHPLPLVGDRLAKALRLLGHHHRLARQRRMALRSEEHTSELQSLMRISYAVFCLKKKIERQIKLKPEKT